MLASEVLGADLRTIAYKEAGLVYHWYEGVVLMFTTLTGGAETVLTERLGKTTLNTLQQTLTVYSLVRVAEISQTVLFRETLTHSLLTSKHKTYFRRTPCLDLFFANAMHENYI